MDVLGGETLSISGSCGPGAVVNVHVVPPKVWLIGDTSEIASESVTVYTVSSARCALGLTITRELWFRTSKVPGTASPPVDRTKLASSMVSGSIGSEMSSSTGVVTETPSPAGPKNTIVGRALSTVAKVASKGTSGLPDWSIMSDVRVSVYTLASSSGAVNVTIVLSELGVKVPPVTTSLPFVIMNDEVDIVAGSIGSEKNTVMVELGKTFAAPSCGVMPTTVGAPTSGGSVVKVTLRVWLETLPFRSATPGPTIKVYSVSGLSIAAGEKSMICLPSTGVTVPPIGVAIPSAPSDMPNEMAEATVASSTGSEKAMRMSALRFTFVAPSSGVMRNTLGGV